MLRRPTRHVSGPVPFWSIPRIWDGETGFIIAGGPSVAHQDLGLLRGRKVIAINSSYERYPDADFVYSMDARWLQHHRRVLETRFAGRVVTCSSAVWKGLLKVRRFPRPGLNDNPETLAPEFTSLSGAIQLAIKLGAGPVVLIGADGWRKENGRTHHHKPHPWPHNPQANARHHADLKRLAGQLKERGLAVVNASPGTHWPDLWPVMDLEAALAWAALEGKAANDNG